MHGEACRDPPHYVLLIKGVVTTSYVGARVYCGSDKGPQQRAVLVLESYLSGVITSLWGESIYSSVLKWRGTAASLIINFYRVVSGDYSLNVAV